jgi:hypothetical protein
MGSTDMPCILATGLGQTIAQQTTHSAGIVRRTPNEAEVGSLVGRDFCRTAPIGFPNRQCTFVDIHTSVPELVKCYSDELAYRKLLSVTVLCEVLSCRADRRINVSVEQAPRSAGFVESARSCYPDPAGHDDRADARQG